MKNSETEIVVESFAPGIEEIGGMASRRGGAVAVCYDREPVTTTE